MSDVIKVHQLQRLVAQPDDIRAEHLRAVIRRRPVVIQDAQTGERFIPTLVGRRIELAPAA